MTGPGTFFTRDFSVGKAVAAVLLATAGYRIGTAAFSPEGLRGALPAVSLSALRDLLPARRDTTVPEVTMREAADRLAAVEGKPLVAVLFTRCPATEQMMPLFARDAAEARKRGAEVLAIAFDSWEYRDGLGEFVRSRVRAKDIPVVHIEDWPWDGPLVHPTALRLLAKFGVNAYDPKGFEASNFMVLVKDATGRTLLARHYPHPASMSTAIAAATGGS